MKSGKGRIRRYNKRDDKINRRTIMAERWSDVLQEINRIICENEPDRARNIMRRIKKKKGS